MNIKKFESICRMSQPQLKEYVVKKLSSTHDIIVSDDGFVYAQGSFPVLLVAHMDTVHKDLPSTIVHNSKTQSISSPNGIGGDDRCGIYMVLEVIKKFNCSVLFTEDEEVGGIGADKFAATQLAKGLEFNYMIEFDRANSNDAVFYDCDNPEFTEFITRDFYVNAWGSFSDISVIAPVIGCAAVNLSCGYYKAHTKDEYVVLPEMEKSIEEACKILERTTEDDKFEYIETEYGGYYGSYRWSYGYNDFKYWTIEYTDKKGKVQWFETEACTETEAIGKFCMENTDRAFEDIVDICSFDSYY